MPILNLNGFKIANPTILARKSDEELQKYFEGLGWEPIFVEGDDPQKLHPELAKAMDQPLKASKLFKTRPVKHQPTKQLAQYGQ
ncbi:xylulose-5-phosphate phosphoketolase [Agrilactobacillus composti DSM 18527 = JCM 14202]|nr:xylulose-5-phosphate phosphoketolase [Agrilactobacillus composti DSM 18527 = JCM 14202]